MSKLHESCLASPLSTKINLKPSRENADFSNGDFPWVSPGASNHLVVEKKHSERKNPFFRWEKPSKSALSLE